MSFFNPMRRVVILYLSSLVLVESAVSCNGNTCTLSLEDGTSFTGVLQGQNYLAFKGLKYANANRWEAPVEVRIRNASNRII